MSESKKVLYDEQGLQVGCLYSDLKIFVEIDGKVSEAQLHKKEKDESLSYDYGMWGWSLYGMNFFNRVFVGFAARRYESNQEKGHAEPT